MSTTLTISTPRGPVPGQGKGNAIPVEGVQFYWTNSGVVDVSRDVVITVKDGPWIPPLLQAATDGSPVSGSIDGAFSVKFTNAQITSFQQGGDQLISFTISGKFEFVKGGAAEGAGTAAAIAAAAEGVRYLKKQTQ